MEVYEFLIVILICSVLPVSIVWIVGRVKQNETNKRAEIMLKALEKGEPIDPNFILPKKERVVSVKEELLRKLKTGCITGLIGVVFLTLGIVKGCMINWAETDYPRFLTPVIGGILIAVGITNLILYFSGKKMMAKEIEAEEKKISNPEE